MDPPGIAFDDLKNAHLLRCKKPKKCEYCAAIRRKEIAHKIVRLFGPMMEEGLEVGLTTLAIRWRDDKEKEIVNRNASTFWYRFRSNFWKAGLKFDYAKVVEYTDEKVKHFHVVHHPILKESDVEEAWVWATRGSWKIDVSPVKNIHNLAAYLSKYLTKMNFALYGHHERIVSYSESLREEVDLAKYEIIEVPATKIVGYFDYNGNPTNRYTGFPAKCSKLKKDGTRQYIKRKRLRKPWTIILGGGFTLEWFVLNREALEAANRFTCKCAGLLKVMVSNLLKVKRMFGQEDYHWERTVKRIKRKPRRRYSTCRRSFNG